MSERVEAGWHFDLMVDCPHCGKNVNLLDNIEFWDRAGRFELSVGDQDFELDEPCPECGKTIECITLY